MDYEIEKLINASVFLKNLADTLPALGDDEQKMSQADLVSHIERLIIVAQKLRGVRQDAEKARFLASQI